MNLGDSTISWKGSKEGPGAVVQEAGKAFGGTVLFVAGRLEAYAGRRIYAKIGNWNFFMSILYSQQQCSRYVAIYKPVPTCIFLLKKLKAKSIEN